MKKLMSRETYEEYVKTIPQDACPLCEPENQIVLGQTEHWIWIANISPYWKYHTMLVPKRHLSFFSELSPAELSEFQSLLKRIIKRYLAQGLTYEDGKPINQFITMFRESTEKADPAYYKMDHLHVHVSPDRRGVNRFKLDPDAITVAVEDLRFPETLI